MAAMNAPIRTVAGGVPLSGFFLPNVAPATYKRHSRRYIC